MKKTGLFVILITLSYFSGNAQSTTFPAEVGIGISPTTMLHVFKNAAPIIKLESADQEKSYFRLGESSDFRGGFLEYDGSVNTFFLGYHNTADNLTSSDVRTISIRRTNGHVGINESVPAALFSVGAGSRFQVNSDGLMYTQTGSASFPSHGFVGDHNTGMYSSGAETIDFATDGVNRLSITSSGKIGIGTATPVEALDVNGHISVNGHLLSSTTSNHIGIIGGQDFLYGAFNSGGVIIGSNSSKNGLTTASIQPLSIWHTASQPVEIGTNNIARLTVLSNGDVGIGTNDTKGYKLAINGEAIATRLVVKQYSAWPDYVFQNNYNLKPLSQIEAYIKQHSHLPEVPSAAEIENNGLDLGSMQATLLKKIEELTLHLIAQNKRLEAQQKQISELKSELRNK